MTMNNEVNANLVIEELSKEVAKLTKEKAILSALLTQINTENEKEVSANETN